MERMKVRAWGEGGTIVLNGDDIADAYDVLGAPLAFNDLDVVLVDPGTFNFKAGEVIENGPVPPKEWERWQILWTPPGCGDAG